MSENTNIICEDCHIEMELVDFASGLQSNGCDADVDIYACPVCGEGDSE